MIRRSTTLIRANGYAMNTLLLNTSFSVEVRTKLDSSRQPGKRLKIGRYGKQLAVAVTG